MSWIPLEPKWKTYIVQSDNPIFTPQECQEIIKIGQSQKTSEAEVHTGVPGDKVRQKVNKTYRISKIRWIPFNQAPNMYANLEDWMLRFNTNFFGYDGMRLTTPAQYTEYSKGEFYDWHLDSSMEGSTMPMVRKISMTLLLSDPKDFKGGNLELIKPHEPVLLKQGHAIFFASFLAHRVTRVTKGNRKSLVMWFGGPPLR